MTDELHVQEYLRDHDYADLLSEFGIEHRMSKDYPLVMLDYNMYLTPPGKKSHPILLECRGTTLDSRDHSLIAKSFNRFFNYGELSDDPFDFSEFQAQVKEDGSLIKIYFFENRWHINTRFSFGTGQCCDSDMSWEMVVLKVLGLETVEDLDRHLDRNLTYICELCSPWNKVIREYAQPKVFLLSIFEGAKEFSYDECEKANSIFERPEIYRFGSVDEILDFLETREENDPSFEGFVIRDRFNNRLKIKSKSYLKLSYYFGKRAAFHPRHLIVLVHDGDQDEILAYYPNVRPAYEEVKAKVEKQLEILWNLYRKNAHEFHEAVAGTDLYSVIESLRKLKGSEASRNDLFQVWIQNEDKILRVLFGVGAAEHNLRHKPNYREAIEKNRKSKTENSG